MAFSLTVAELEEGGASKCAAFFSEKPTEGHEIVRASYYYTILKDQSSFNDFL